MTQDVNEGEHKTASTAIKLLRKSRDALQKLITQVEAHSEKMRPEVDLTAQTK